jgi:hypothetical protein
MEYSLDLTEQEIAIIGSYIKSLDVFCIDAKFIDYEIIPDGIVVLNFQVSQSFNGSIINTNGKIRLEEARHILKGYRLKEQLEPVAIIKEPEPIVPAQVNSDSPIDDLIIKLKALLGQIEPAKDSPRYFNDDKGARVNLTPLADNTTYSKISDNVLRATDIN